MHGNVLLGYDYEVRIPGPVCCGKFVDTSLPPEHWKLSGASGTNINYNTDMRLHPQKESPLRIITKTYCY